MGTIVVGLILAVIVALIIIQLRKDKKAGRSTCGANCAHCAMHGSCHAASEEEISQKSQEILHQIRENQ